MYGHGNFAPQLGKGPDTSVPTSQKLVPAHLPPPYQHGNIPQQSLMTEKGPPFFPAPLVGQAFPPPYANENHVPAPTTGILSSGQSYLIPVSIRPLPPLPQVHSAPMAHLFPSPQQRPQWTQNVQQVPQPLHPTFGRLPARNGPEILLPPPPSGLRPPMLSHGQALFRGSVLPPLPGPVQGLQHTPMTQPPLHNSTPYTHGRFGSVVHPVSQDPHGSSASLLPPPLPPSSPPGPPPLPPTSPPPTSPSAHSRSTGAHLPSPPMRHHVTSDGGSHKHSIAEVLDSNSIAKISAPINDNSLVGAVETHLEVDSLVEHSSSSEDKIKFDILPPPFKPRKERVARKIEVLCQYIARNGPEFEEMTRKNELGNPEFEFLFGGSPGSEAAAAHEYFLWMKKKCSLSRRVEEGKHHSNSSLRPIQHDVLQEEVQPGDSSARPVQLDSLMDAGVSHSPAVSDMDIEDEMTRIDEKQKCSEPVEGVDDKSIVISSEREVGKQVHEAQIFAKHTAADDSISKNIFCSDTSEFVEHREAAGVDYESVSTELVTHSSAFKLLQDYASDDNSESDHEPCIEDIGSTPVYPTGKSISARLDGEKGPDLVVDGTTKHSSESEKGFGPSSECVVASAASMPSKSLGSSMELQGASREVDTALTVKDKRHDDNSHVNEQYISSGISDKAVQQKSYGESHVRPASDIGKTRKEDGKYNSAKLKIDEFGRLVREGASDSDSDDLSYSKRHGKRGRSRIRSRSPHDRRSPQRRRQKRSPSRSWSPKKRRTRSRSPNRHGVQYGSDRTRQDKGPRPTCFDYQRGKCYRGASCRYSHSDSTKGDVSRHYSSKYQANLPNAEKIVKPVHEHDEVKSQEMQLCEDLSGNSLCASKDCNIYQKEVVMSSRSVPGKDVELLISSVAESARTQEKAAQFQETQHTREDLVESPINNPGDNICVVVGETPQLVDSYAVDHVTDVDARKSLPGSTCHGIESSSDKLVVQYSEANLVNQVHQNADRPPQHMDVPSAFQSLPASEANSIPASIPESHPDTTFDRSYPATGSASKLYSSETYTTQQLRSGEPSPKNSYQLSQFPPPPPPPPMLQAANSPLQMPRDCIMMPQSSRYQPHPTPLDSLFPHQIPFPGQSTSFSGLPNSAWNSLPPPSGLRYVNGLAVHVSSSYGLPSSQFQQNQLPLRNYYPQVLVGSYPTEMHTHSQVGEFHRRTYPPTQDPNQPLSHTEDNKSNALPPVSTTTQEFGGPSAVGEDRLRSLPGHGYPVSSAQGSMYPQPVPLSRGSPVGRMQSFSSDNLHSGERLSSSSQRHSHLQQPSDALEHLTADSVSVLGKPGKINSESPSCNSDDFERNLPSHVPDFVGSSIPTYYNPYTSTFEQPASSKAGSHVFSQAKGMPFSNICGDPFSSSHVSADGRVVDSLDSKDVNCSTNSNQAVEKLLPNSIGDQYDPLFDSIEPSSNSFKTSNTGPTHEITDHSDMILRLSGSKKPLDLAENTKQRESVAVMSSLDNDEYGETAEAEVGAVENGSPSDPIDEDNTAAGEIEIDKVKTSGNSKKGNDSRSIKLFKVALADFVKEVLKPSWRQGNLSKEAFKTIVKKTVEKVSGAMKSHQVPKSQTKINHYIDSSQRKLTKLVMGYVDKYVKV